MKILFTDLDGTLLNSSNKISSADIQTVESLGTKGVIRVIATGRSIFITRKVIPKNFPIDYLLFSTGVGILEWKTKKIIYKNFIPRQAAQKIAEILITQKKNFAAHQKIPYNHHYQYFAPNNINDSYNRNKIYKDYITPLKSITDINDSSQFVVILSNKISEFIELQQIIASKIKGIRIVRATSPLNASNNWFEIYSKKVSKGLTAMWLCKKLNISRNNTVGIGNDYNDIDLLKFTHKSFMVENAPSELKKMFEITSSNNHNGVSNVIKKVLSV